MKSIMFKHIQIVKIVLHLFCLAIIISICIFSVHTYSRSIGLFDEFDIQISGNDYIDTSFINNEIYPQMSSSLLSINITDIQNKLESLDYIEAVQISRILPHTLMIHIVERSPMVLMNNADEISFMDNKGVVLPVDEKSIYTFPVPVISILNDNSSLNEYTLDRIEYKRFSQI